MYLHGDVLNVFGVPYVDHHLHSWTWLCLVITNYV